MDCVCLLVSYRPLASTSLNQTIRPLYVADSPPYQTMILTTCAACAAPLAHDAPRCIRCKLRYLNATLDDLVEAVETLEAVAKLWKRVMGERHPETPAVLEALKVAREKLRLRRAASG